MKKSFLILVFTFLMLIKCYSQMPGFLWAKCATSTYEGAIRSVTSDSRQNVIGVGEIQTYVTLDTLTLSTWQTYYHAFVFTPFIVKYDPFGNVLWAKIFSGKDNDRAKGVVTDNEDNIYVSGTFISDTLFIDSTFVLRKSGVDIYLAKFDSLGTLKWVKVFPGPPSNSLDVYSISIDYDSNILLGGWSQRGLVIGTDTLLFNQPNNSFIIKCDSSGTVKWLKGIETFNRNGLTDPDSYITAVKFDHLKNVIVAGVFEDSILQIDSLTIVNVTGTYSDKDIFLAKFDSLGNYIWAKLIRGFDDNDFVTSIDVDNANNIFITGNYRSSQLIFGSNTIPGGTSGLDRMFVAKYDMNGHDQWANNVSGSTTQRPYSITTDVQGSCYVTGSYEGSNMVFGSISLSNLSPARSDLFIVKYNSTGLPVWAKSSGGNGYDQGLCIHNDNSGNILFGGSFNSPSITLGPYTLTTPFSTTYNFFVAKLGYPITGINTIEQQEISISYNAQINQIVVKKQNNEGLIRLFDTVGRKVFEEKISALSNTVPLPPLSNGVYVVNYSQDKISESLKIFITQ